MRENNQLCFETEWKLKNRGTSVPLQRREGREILTSVRWKSCRSVAFELSLQVWKDLDRLQERSQTVQAEGEEQRQRGVGMRKRELTRESRGCLWGMQERTWVGLGLGTVPRVVAGGGVHEEPMRTGGRGAGQDNTIYVCFRKGLR